MNITYNELIANILEVYDVFKNFFGEQFVDLQNIPSKEQIQEISDKYPTKADLISELVSKNSYPFIYVYWPNVTVSNEFNKSINIQDLYAKIYISYYGNIPSEQNGFTLIRTTYSKMQWHCGYLHSHCPCVTESNCKYFKNPCLGTGPIKNTINELKVTFNLTTWLLFCQELSIYVTVESLSGGPYIELERIFNHNNLKLEQNSYNLSSYSLIISSHITTLIGTDFYKTFIKYYLKHGHFKLSYINGMFTTGLSYYDFRMDISNCFIDYVNNRILKKIYDSDILNALQRNDVLITITVKDHKFYIENNQSRYMYNVNDDDDIPIGLSMLTFKGTDIKLKILDDANAIKDEKNECTFVLNHGLIMYLLRNILKVINYYYKKSNESNSNNNEVTTSANSEDALFL